MAVVNAYGYVCRKSSRRNWWIVKYAHPNVLAHKSGLIHIDTIGFPKQYVGKRIRLKVEVIK